MTDDIYDEIREKVLDAGLRVLAVAPGSKIVDAIVEFGWAKSKREARHLIESGAVRLSRVPPGLQFSKN